MLNSMSSHPSNECARCNCSSFGPTAGHMSHDASMYTVEVIEVFKFGEDCPIITSSSMTLMEFLSPQKIPKTVRGQGSTIAGPQIKKPLKWHPQKRHPQFLLLDLAFLRGKNLRIFAQKKLFSPIHSGVVVGSWNIQNLSAQLLFRRLSAIPFFSGGKHILATVPVGSHILKALCLDVLPNSREA